MTEWEGEKESEIELGERGFGRDTGSTRHKKFSKENDSFFNKTTCVSFLHPSLL